MRPMDLTKFRKNLTKSIDGLSIGFHDPDTWVSTGNYGLNYLLSGNFYHGIPMGKVVMLAGESGSGKSYIASGNIVKNAQEQGIFVVIIDTENALDEQWLHNLGVDTSPEKLLKLNMAMIDDISKTIFSFVDEYKTNYMDLPIAERPKVLFVVDSLGMALSSTSVEQAQAGSLRGDLGIKPKQLKALVSNCVNMFGQYGFTLLGTQHTYMAQDKYSDDTVAGGAGFVYAASMVVTMQKLKLKEDEDGNKITEVRGIRSSCKVVKTRYAKPFESIKINIPYDTGMSPISGLFELFENAGVFVRIGNRYKYVVKSTGEELFYFKKEWNDEEKLKIVMDDLNGTDLFANNPSAIIDTDIVENI